VITYVLVGDIGGDRYAGTNQQILTARANLRALLAEVQAVEESTSIPVPELKWANLFAIPAKLAPPVYDFSLANNYRHTFARLLKHRPDLMPRLYGHGPFLVAVRSPISELNENSHIVLVDLSSAMPPAVAVFVKEFKKAIRSDAVTSDRELRPLRAIIASALIKVDLAVPFIGGAYASVTALPFLKPSTSPPK
jgi:hypothetical protein